MPQPFNLQHRIESRFTKNGNGQCWVWFGTSDRDGYGYLVIKGRQVQAHRASWMVYRGPIPNNTCVLHSCDNPACVNPGHLFLGSKALNNLDMCLKGRQVKGEENGQAKLTETQVREILKRHKNRDKVNGCKALAIEFGVSPRAIGFIVKRINWKYIQ